MPPVAPFTFDQVRAVAKTLAGQPFMPPNDDLPGVLRDLSADDYRRIRFRPELALWRKEGLPFQVQFFHRGSFYRAPVRINTVEEGKIEPVPYTPLLFDYGRLGFDGMALGDLGFAGLGLHYALNAPGALEEVAVFLGASYFRAIGRGSRAGVWARGLAIDTGLSKEEEFPYFREFWLEKPAKDATVLTFYALLDSASVAGAYLFQLYPGEQTRFDITASLYFRKDVEKLGVAPLTSMFLYGENSTRRFPDYRPEVHDSDGLAIHSGAGEWIWRPLFNPEGSVSISAFADEEGPRAFGLLQRDRAFDHFQDLELAYQQRPSAWVDPAVPWGKGGVELIEIDAPQETFENIVAFWVPEQPAQAGQERNFAYSVAFGTEFQDRPPGGRVVATRVGAAREAGVWHFAVDFTGGQLDELPADAPVEAVLSASRGELRRVMAVKNAPAGGWRAAFDLAAARGDTVDLRGALRLKDGYLTETWIYRFVVP
ncbi:MAG: glucan biosynthesis protein [Rhodospirillaceae bacterium]|nr:glucan biosynthesis protein [Rhodospirillaceae bacterium]